MKVSRSFERRWLGMWFSGGYGARLALGFSVDRYAINLEILCFWLAVELPAKVVWKKQ
jgi:hypothetical protein